ncbi:MAG: hypothetical protein CVT92_09965 [Bacteroidetes bacterium HGW-Bacteroidetes-1]|nr:MAG: hypothetical protein CVT92_09965 [Bacteroidetes bacterium HGW-Bacteroidetes-1]
MINRLLRFQILLVFILFYGVVYSQKIDYSNNSDRINAFNPEWHLTVSGGTSVFLGDVKQNPVLPSLSNRSELRYVGSIGFGRRFSSVLGLRIETDYSHVLGTSRLHDIHFQSEIFEGNLVLQIYPINLLTSFKSDRLADFYLVAGGGLINFNSILYQLIDGKTLAKSGFGNGRGIGGRTLEGMLFGGFGIEFPVHSNWAIRFEMANRILNSDMLDLKQSGSKYDMYNYATFGIRFKFDKSQGKKSRAPDASKPNLKEKEVAEKKDDQYLLNKIVENDSAVEEKQQIVKDLSIITEVTMVDTTLQLVIEKEAFPVSVQSMNREYRVQIFAAGGKKVEIERLALHFRLQSSEIKEDVYNGMYIYSVGSYNSYEEAASRRNLIRSENGVKDAFIVFFENGKRLPRLPYFKK